MAAPPSFPLGRLLTDADVDALGAGHLVVKDHALGDELALGCRDALVALEREGALEPAGVGRDARFRDSREIRGDLCATLTADTSSAPLRAAWHRFELLRVELAREARLALPRFELQAACYPGDGARYRRHLDALRGLRHRVVSAVWYLNPGWSAWQGGELRVWDGEDILDVEPALDRLVLFRSDTVWHEVLPCRTHRYAITAWYRT